MQKVLLVVCFLLVVSSSIQASDDVNNPLYHPFYVGFNAGYGATTWDGLVPAEEKQNETILISTPISADEGGAVWGFFAGYEFLPMFAVETYYTRYPKARVVFDEQSLFTYDHEGSNILRTKTETAGVKAKIMLMIPRTEIRLFSGIGLAGVHRSDNVKEQWQASPTFTGGLNYNFSTHIMGEFGADYTAGNGESELEPSKDFIPFLYSIFLKLAYRF